MTSPLLLLAGLLTSKAYAADILYCVDSTIGTDAMAEALAVSAHTVTSTTDLDSECELQIASGAYDLVIVAIQGSYHSMPFFTAWMATGGRTIVQDWTLPDDAATAATYGLIIEGENLDVLSGFGGSIDGSLPSTITLDNPGWGTYSMSVSGVGTTLGSFEDGNASIVRAGDVIFNGFLTDTEYLPQAGYQVFSYPLEGTPLLYGSRSEFAHVRRSNADPVGSRGDSYSVFRADTEQRLSWPFLAGPFSLEPNAGFRETAYQRNRGKVERAVAAPLADQRGSDDPLTREALLYGCSVSTEFFRVYDAESDLLEIDRLRHNVIPSAVLTGVRGVTEKPKDVPQFDGVDTVASREAVDLSVRHLFLTKRGPRRDAATFADVDWRSTWFPDPNRDNPALRRDGRTVFRDFSTVRQDAALFPRGEVTLRSDTLYDPYGGAVDTQTTGMSLRAGRLIRGPDRSGRYLFSADLDRTDRDWGKDPQRSGDPFSESGVGLAIEHRHRRNLDTLGSIALQVQFTERWGADYQVTRELEPDQRWKSRRLTVHRRIHDGALEVFYEIDDDTGEYRVAFNFTTYGL